MNPSTTSPAAAAQTAFRPTSFSPDALTKRAIERRAVEAAIWGIPLVNVDAMRQPYFQAGAKYNDCIYWSNPNTWTNQTTTPNHSTSYVMFFMNLKFRIYDPEKGAVDSSWVLDDIEEVK